jgi:hypothetical protein
MFQRVLLITLSLTMALGFRLNPDSKLIEAGKIYVKDNQLFVNDIRRGVHIYDITDISNPTQKQFIAITDNVDIAVYGNYLFADKQMDLVVYDISNLDSPEPVFTYKDAFQRLWESDPWMDEGNDFVEGDDDFGFGCFCPLGGMSESDSKADNSNGSGQGGSMARFTIIDDYLYAVDLSYLTVFNITDPTHPIKIQELFLGWNIETIFPYNNHLFIGSMDGMYIYEILEGHLVESSSKIFFTHATSCDPVFVLNDTAYITLRAGNNCRSTRNELNMVDVHDVKNPKLIKSFNMINPHGLAVKDNLIYICEGASGLFIYRLQPGISIKSVFNDPDYFAYDVILQPERLILTGKKGLRLYSIENPESPKAEGDITQGK